MPDHTGELRKLSELQGEDPLILTLARGHYCPKEHQQRYDLLPDRLVLYLWPNAGGTKLHVRVPSSIRAKARTAPSVLYDYCNPEALVALPPTDFNIKPSPESEPGNTVAAE